MESTIKTVDKITKVLNWFAMTCFSVIILFIVVDVFLRFVFNAPILGSFEIVERFMFCGVFCSFAYAQNSGANIHIFLFLILLPKKLAVFVYALGELASAAICGVMLYAMIRQANIGLTRHYVTAILKIPTFPFAVVAIIGVAAMLITLLWSTIRTFIALGNEPLRAEITSNWV